MQIKQSQMDKVHYSSNSEEWETPQDLFDALDSIYHFTLDACASIDNYKVAKYYTKEDDGLSKSWEGEKVWCNPPYGRGITGLWVKKAYDEWYSNYDLTKPTIIVMLLPARTDTKWFHDYLCFNNNIKIDFIKGRLKFSGSKNSAPFPSMIVTFQ